MEDPPLTLLDTPIEDNTSNSGSTTVSPIPNNSALTCEMCQNYETNLTNLQDTERKLKEELKAVRALAERYESELAEERQYRLDLERKMSETAVQTEEALADSLRSHASLSAKLDSAIEASGKSRMAASKLVDELSQKLATLEEEHKKLSDKYLDLLGRQRSCAEAMRAEPIDMPGDVDQLQFMCLQYREELIECRAGREHEENCLKDEIAALVGQLEEEKTGNASREKDMVKHLNDIQTQLGIANSQVTSAGEVYVQSEEQARQIKELQGTVAELEAQVQQVQSERNSIEQSAANYRDRCKALQKELDTSEAVQKDFVMLSQNLQVQLEKIRQSEQEVRFQWEDDVDKCPTCSTSLVRLPKPRPRCLHCGKIFCANCVRHTVPSGPSKRLAPVCEVCHTLLNRDQAPFFSREPKNNSSGQ